MNRNRKFNSRELVEKIERLTKERMASEKVVSFDNFRKLKENPPSLLIIEDDETMRLALRRIFEEEGYRVVTAADGTQLCQVLDDSLIDLIILDVGLPWINGFEIATLMKGHEDLKDIPLVFVSGRCSEEDVKRCFEVGADDFIKKPFDMNRIKKTVSTLIHLAHS